MGETQIYWTGLGKIALLFSELSEQGATTIIISLETAQAVAKLYLGTGFLAADRKSVV